jgi:hypothetical protein
VSMQDKKIEFYLGDQCNVQDKFRTAIDALGKCKVEKHRQFGTTCEDAYFGHIFEQST